MSEWIESALANLAVIVSGGTPSREVKAYWGGETPWVTPTDITACTTNYLETSEDTITKEGLLNSSAKLLPAGSILVTSRASIGLSKITRVPVATNQGFKSLIPKPDVDAIFLFYQTQRLRGAFEKFAAGSTFLEINKKDTERIPFPHPTSIKEQRKISVILTAMDAAIEKTEALIVKYQQIKAGLMHDLFTRGILPNGKLRPPRSEAPELYQETLIGWFPSEWKFARCADICSRICVGIVIQPTQYYVDDGVPAFRSANIREVGIDSDNLVFISPISNQLLVKSQVRAGDIVSVRTGYPGTSAVVPPEFTGANCIDILISTPSNLVDPQYLCDWINSSFGKWQVLRQQGGMAQQHFNVGEMRELLVALPHLDEQKKIRSRIKAISDKLVVEQAMAKKLLAQKRGLMQDLLTGKVPVQVEEPNTEVTA